MVVPAQFKAQATPLQPIGRENYNTLPFTVVLISNRLAKAQFSLPRRNDDFAAVSQLGFVVAGQIESDPSCAAGATTKSCSSSPFQL